MFAKVPLNIERQIKFAIDTLRDGGLVAFPTDTVFGLGACFDNIAAVKRIFEVKQRPFNTGLPLLAADKPQIGGIVKYIPEVANLLINRFLPGGLTLILQKNVLVPDIVSGGRDTIAVRIPAHPIALGLIRGVGKPIVGTSANKSGKPSGITAEDVRSQIGEEIEFIIEGEAGQGGKESTIVDITGSIPRLLREGVISRTELEKVCQID
ncbi:MAG: threonylcarbamoyl-AMP synthase [Dehalococcoidia bacterium]|nr:MAG: threonylcarbamoyl-AMP synthase [Dehalococcoidia bacterium]